MNHHLRWRERGYRLFGPRLDYLLHLRPSEWPIVALHMVVGYGLALGRLGISTATGGWTLGVGVLAWVVCLNGGTLAINSAFDQDTDDIAYLRAPPRPPRHLFLVGTALMAFGAGWSWSLPVEFRIAYLVSIVLSLLYSVPPFRFKRIAGVDWVINIVGFGFLTPYAGYALAGVPMDAAAGRTLLGFAVLFGAFYPLTQLYQIDEDRARGDRTLALALGVRGSLVVAIVGVGLAWTLFFSAALPLLWSKGAWPITVLSGALGVWLGVLVPWVLNTPTWSATRHQHGMYYALGAWAVTDVAMVMAWML